MELGSSTLLLGLVTGLTYAILAAGVVLIYRATKVINFAHGEIGALGAAVLAKLVLDLHWSFVPALLVALATGAAVGAAVELLVVRRLFHAPRLIVLVATIGVSQLVFVGRAVLPAIQLIMSISDRVYCLAAGVCVAEGKPEQVRHDPAVVAAYLGTDERAIARSGARAGAVR